MTSLDSYIVLCRKYKCYSYFSFLSNVPFAACQSKLKTKEFDENVKIATRYARKEKFTEEQAGLYEYFRRYVQPLENDFFDNLCKINNIDCSGFAKSVILWLSKKHPKRNTLKLIGIPNSCKTLIANIFREIFLCANWLNSSTGSAFNFGNLIYSSIIIIEEPFIPPTLLEDIKSVCGGAPLSVDVKYSAFEVLQRTPVLITSNFSALSRGHSPPVSETAIDVRSYVYSFNHVFIPSCTVTPGHFLYFLQKYGFNEFN